MTIQAKKLPSKINSISTNSKDEKNNKYSTLLKVNVLTKKVLNPLWFSISESAKLGGVKTKTIRRAIQSKAIIYKIIGNRYYIDLASLIIYLHSKTKLKNKLKQFGIGQYIDKWGK